MASFLPRMDEFAQQRQPHLRLRRREGLPPPPRLVRPRFVFCNFFVIHVTGLPSPPYVIHPLSPSLSSSLSSLSSLFPLLSLLPSHSPFLTTASGLSSSLCDSCLCTSPTTLCDSSSLPLSLFSFSFLSFLFFSYLILPSHCPSLLLVHLFGDSHAIVPILPLQSSL